MHVERRPENGRNVDTFDTQLDARAPNQVLDASPAVLVAGGPAAHPGIRRCLRFAMVLMRCAQEGSTGTRQGASDNVLETMAKLLFRRSRAPSCARPNFGGVLHPPVQTARPLHRAVTKMQTYYSPRVGCVYPTLVHSPGFTCRVHATVAGVRCCTSAEVSAFCCRLWGIAEP